MADVHEKSLATAQEIHTVSDHSSLEGKNLDEVAIHDLETTGEVVGMTPRSVMAFLVIAFSFQRDIH
jgi:hypothetical protein